MLANACYELVQHRPNDWSYAGISLEGFMQWEKTDSGAVDFHLYQSADAGYRVQVRTGEGANVGIGYSWGIGAVEIERREDVVRLKRIGRESLSACPELPAEDYNYEE